MKTIRRRVIAFALVILCDTARAGETIAQSLESMSKAWPPPQGFHEENGFAIELEDGTRANASYLNRLARGLKVKSKTDALILFSYAREPNIKVRYVAFRALIYYLDAFGVKVEANPAQISLKARDPNYALIVSECSAALEVAITRP
jgi:hypothetical protein